MPNPMMSSVTSRGIAAEHVDVDRREPPVGPQRRQAHEGEDQADDQSAAEAEEREDQGVPRRLGDDVPELLAEDLGIEELVLDPHPVDVRHEERKDRQGDGVDRVAGESLPGASLHRQSRPASSGRNAQWVEASPPPPTVIETTRSWTVSSRCEPRLVDRRRTARSCAARPSRLERLEQRGVLHGEREAVLLVGRERGRDDQLGIVLRGHEVDREVLEGGVDVVGRQGGEQLLAAFERLDGGALRAGSPRRRSHRWCRTGRRWCGRPATRASRRWPRPRPARAATARSRSSRR